MTILRWSMFSSFPAPTSVSHRFAIAKESHIPAQISFILEKEVPCKGKKKRKEVVEMLRNGKAPLEILDGMGEWSPVVFWAVIDFLRAHGRIAEALQRLLCFLFLVIWWGSVKSLSGWRQTDDLGFSILLWLMLTYRFCIFKAYNWWKRQKGYRPCEQHYTRFINMLGKAQMVDSAEELFNEMETLDIQPTVATWTSLCHAYAASEQYEKVEEIIRRMVDSGKQPTVVTYTGLIYIYGKKGLYNLMSSLLIDMKSVGCIPDSFTYQALIKAYARGGVISRMEKVYTEMLEKGWPPDSESLNMMVQAYATVGLLREMRKLYLCFKMFRVSVNKLTIETVALAYIRENLFHQLGEFAKEVGLRRPDVGNLLWNLVLLSCSSNFSMKNLQREFMAMVESGFSPDLTSFNIRVLAFSRMQMFWDLHIAVLHMHSLGIIPDIVTYGAVVDAYLEGKLETKLATELDELQMGNLFPDVRTDPMVFKAFGKGDFHVFCEDSLSGEQSGRFETTYSQLTSLYVSIKHAEPRKRTNSLGSYNSLITKE